MQIDVSDLQPRAGCSVKRQSFRAKEETRIMTADQLTLYATNTGSLYETHKKLARGKAGFSVWEGHVRNAILPLYRKEMNEPFEGVSRAELEKAAVQLKRYYENHITEGA